MTTEAKPAWNTTVKVGWIVLLAISILAAVNHIALIFFIPDEAALFVGWAAFNLYSTVVLFIPFRRGEKWAWYASWILVVGFATLILFDSEVGLYYLIAAGVMAVGLLLTRSAFFGQE